MTVMRAATMAKLEPRSAPKGEGEQREAARRRWRFIITGALFAFGLGTGLLIEDREGAGSGVWAEKAAQPGQALALVTLSATSWARLASPRSLRSAISAHRASERSQRSRTMSRVAALALVRASWARSR